MAKDGKTVIIACDHGAFIGPAKGLEEPDKLINEMVESGVDAILTTRGIAQRFGNLFGKLGLILRADGGSSIASPVTGSISRIVSVENACQIGADAIICMGMIGFQEEPSSLKNLSAFVAESDKWGMPIIAEMLIKPKEGKRATSEEIAFASRIGVELGADMIKASYAGPIESYKKALQSCYRPVVVLGGEKVNNDQEMLQNIADALKAGASGVAIGRNVWQHSNPGGVCRALVELVHGSGRVDKALKEIE